MASYTDKIPTFNPYVQQLPVEAMLKVGMYKQQKYEEGVQRIQTNIDNVAGLDIANPVQQKYLQSKLNTLGNNLKFVAAGDFSDFSLVNSVNGMTKQIVKDEDVINAVSSTSKLRAGYKKREELSKKGLTDKNNDDYYDKFASEYINDKNVKAKFSADYVPYTNIVKKLQEALVGAGESANVAQEIFVTGDDGKPVITNGKYTYADAKTIDKLVTNKPAVLAAINNVMSQGDVRQQLGIDGWARYKDTEATTLLEPLKTQYDEENERLQSQSLEISSLLTATNLSPEQREAYTKASTEIEASILSNNNTFTSLTEQAQGSPEEFKQNFYAKDVKQNLINQFVKETKSREYGTNEALQQQNWRDTMAFNTLQEKNKIAYQNQTLAIAKSGDKRAWMEFEGNYGVDPVTGEIYKKDTTTTKKKVGTIDANAPLFAGNVPGDKVSAVNMMKEDISTLTSAKGDIAFTMYADLIRANKNDYNLTDESILANVKNYATKQGITPEQYLDRWAVNIKNKYAELGLKPPPNLEDELNEYTTTSKTLKNKMTMSKAAEIAADKEAGVDESLTKLLNGKKTLNFNVNGTKLVLEPKDMVSFTADKIQWALTHQALANPNFPDTELRDNLTPNQLKIIQNWHNLPPGMTSSIYRETYNYDKGDDDRTKHAATLSKANELFNEKLSKIVGVTDVKGGSLPMFTADQIKASVANVSSYLSVGMRSYGKGDTEETVQAALANPTSISWTGKKPTNAKEEWTGSIIVKDAKGVKHTITNVNHDELQQFTGLNLTSYEEKPVQDLINMNDKTKSTNSIYGPSSPKAWTTSYFQANEVNPEVTRAGWGYRADAVKSSGGYRLVNYVKPPGENRWITMYGGAIAKEEGMIDTIFKTTSPKDLENLYMIYLQNQTQNK
jgi:hypothetical protein